MIAAKTAVVFSLLSAIHTEWNVDLFVDDASTKSQQMDYFTDVINGSGCVKVGNFGTVKGIHSIHCSIKLLDEAVLCREPL